MATDVTYMNVRSKNARGHYKSPTAEMSLDGSSMIGVPRVSGGNGVFQSS